MESNSECDMRVLEYSFLQVEFNGEHSYECALYMCGIKQNYVLHNIFFFGLFITFIDFWIHFMCTYYTIYKNVYPQELIYSYIYIYI